MARVKVCRLCDAHNGPDELFCTDCGSSLADVRAVHAGEAERLKAAVEADASAAGGAGVAGGDEQRQPAAAVQSPPAAGGHTVRDPSAASCTLLFPWGRVPVPGQLGIGRESGFSPINRQLDTYPTVSRRHAVISVAHGQWAVRDLGSTNGTYLNEARLPTGETRPIGNGDRVGFSRGLQVVVEIAAA